MYKQPRVKLENKQIFPQLILSPETSLFRVAELNKDFTFVEIGEIY